MSPSTPAPCTHERRPGTTVCLRCRREARLAGRKRTFGIALRACALVLALATIGAIGSTGARALQEHRVTAADAAPRGASGVEEQNEAVAIKAAPRADTASERDSAADIPAQLAAAPSPSQPKLDAPIVDEGRTELGDGLFAVRDGATVTVHFDVPQARTRRRDKFDRIVRATLPRIYGPVAQASLDRIPPGGMVAEGTLPIDLGDTGLRIALADGSALALWPEIREANGGPLVVGYRTALAR